MGIFDRDSKASVVGGGGATKSQGVGKRQKMGLVVYRCMDTLTEERARANKYYRSGKKAATRRSAYMSIICIIHMSMTTKEWGKKRRGGGGRARARASGNEGALSRDVEHLMCDNFLITCQSAGSALSLSLARSLVSQRSTRDFSGPLITARIQRQSRACTGRDTIYIPSLRSPTHNTYSWRVPLGFYLLASFNNFFRPFVFGFFVIFLGDPDS